DHIAVPHPSFGIDGLADCAEQTQAVEFVTLRPLVSPLKKSSDCGGCSVEDVHLMTINDAPEAVLLGKIRSAFVHDASRAILQGPIDDITVTGDPANIGSTPVGVFFLQIEDP